MPVFDDFPAHVRLLFLTADPTPDGAKAERIHALADDPAFDWPGFLALVEHHRLVPLAFQSLTIADVTVPPAIYAEMHYQSARNAFAALEAVAALERLTETFAAAGVPLAVIKGVTLSQVLYGSPSVRHVGDLDLLTPSTDILPQLALLDTLGYTRINPAAELTPRRAAAFVRYWKDVTLAGSSFELDFHWRLFNNPDHPANRLLIPAEASVPALTSVQVFGSTFSTLCLRSMFLYAAAHAAGESFTYLKTLADVAAFLRLLPSQELDEALLYARDLGLLPQVSAAIHLANQWMPAAVSSPHLQPESDALAQRLHRRTAAQLSRQHYLTTRDSRSAASWLRLEHLLTPGPRLLAEVVGRFAFRPRVWSAISLPDSLFALYPLIGLFVPPHRHAPADETAGHSHAAPLTPLESPNTAGTIGVSKSPPKT